MKMQKSIHLTILCFLLVVMAVCAQEPVKTQGRIAESRFDIPAPKNKYVNDFAGIMKESDINDLAAYLENIDRQTGIEISVLTVRNYRDHRAYSAEELARETFNTWGVGDKKHNDGIIILIASENREMWIEPGDGYQRKLKTKLEETIDRSFLPAFRRNDYSSGIVNGTKAVVTLVTRGLKWYETTLGIIAIYGSIIVFLLFMARSCFRDGRDGWGWALIVAAGMTLLFMFKALLTPRRRGIGGGSFGGGFSSGGGGAGGSW